MYGYLLVYMYVGVSLSVHACMVSLSVHACMVSLSVHACMVSLSAHAHRGIS